SCRAWSALIEVEKTASFPAFSAIIHEPAVGSCSRSGLVSTHAIGTGFPLIADRRAFGQTCSSTKGEVQSSEPSTMPLCEVTLQCSSDINEIILPLGSLMNARTRTCAEPG